MLIQKQIAYHANCDGEIKPQSVSFALDMFIFIYVGYMFCQSKSKKTI